MLTARFRLMKGYKAEATAKVHGTNFGEQEQVLFRGAGGVTRMDLFSRSMCHKWTPCKTLWVAKLERPSRPNVKHHPDKAEFETI